MVNIFRRYQQPLMIVVTVFVIVSFAVFYNRSDFLERGTASRKATVYGRSFSDLQYEREKRKFELSRYLVFELWQSLIQPAMSMDEAENNFVWNSVVLRHEADRLGIQPAEAEIEEAIKNLPAFQTNGHYDSNKYTAFVQNGLNPRGLMPDTVEELVGNDIRLRKVKNLLGTTVSAPPSEVRALFEQGTRKLECSVIRFDLADFLKTQQPSDDDVKKTYEERKSTLKTEEQRKVKFVAFALPSSEKPLAGKERVDTLGKLSDQAQEFAVAMTEKGAKLEDVAAKFGVPVQASPAFPHEVPPAELGQSSKAAAAAFKLTMTDPNSDVVPTDKGYYILQLAEVVPAREKTFDEAKAALVEEMKHEGATEAMNLTATIVRGKIEADLKAGKSFAEAAAGAGKKPESFPPFSLREPPMKERDGREVALAASELKEGQLSPFIPSSSTSPTSSGGGLLVYLAKKQPADEKQFEQEKTQLAEEIVSQNREALFHQWIKLRRAAAGIALPESRSPAAAQSAPAPL